MKTIAITDPAEIEAIIRKCPYCTVGITDSEGNPYVIPMNFAYRDGIIYLHSGPDGRTPPARLYHLLRRARTGIYASPSGMQLQHEVA